mmetsp:Transcript_18811/g.23082  ORF Transcript_18811/g.23082 Transcript_18811/m.23082 type:complete len:666 (+) Transcript_18811:241-2238(+)
MRRALQNQGSVTLFLLIVSVLQSFDWADGFSTSASHDVSFTSTQKSPRKFTFLNVASVEKNIDDVSSQSSITPDMKAYSAGYSTAFDELPFQLCTPAKDSNNLPSDLIGTYFRSGPAMFSAGSLLPPKKSLTQPKLPPVPDGQDKDRMVQHPFDGDGAILGITFTGDGKAIARFRYVRTAAFTRERKKGKKLYEGMESTRIEGPTVANGQGNDYPVPLLKHHLLPGLNKLRKNTSNTRAIYWSKKLLTLWEGGLPYKLDALGLSTEGKSQLGGVMGETDSFSGKAVYDSNKDYMIFYSNKQDSKSSKFTLYQFNSKFRVASEVEYKLPGFALISDFAVTEKYAIVVQPPVATNGMQYMLSKDPVKSLKVEQNEALLHLMKRGSEDMKTISIPIDGISDANLHFCNAYDDEDGRVVFDVIRSDSRNIISSSKNSNVKSAWPWLSTIDEYENSCSQNSLWRYIVDVRSRNVKKECITNMQTYFGTINPAKSCKKHKYVYASVGTITDKASPPQGVVKINTETKESQTWYPKEYEFCGEPMFAPRKRVISDGQEEEIKEDSSKEDDGYILSVLFNGVKKESELIVFDASDIAQGPISRVSLGIAVPHGLHGCFASGEECNWSAEEIERRAKLSDKMESRGNTWNEVKSDFSGLGLRLDDFEEYFGDIL